MEWKVNTELSTRYSQPYYKSLAIAFVSPHGAWDETKPGSTLFLSNIMSRCSQKYNEEAIAEAIDGNGASFVYSVKRDMSIFGFRAPPENIENVLPVFADLLINPSFRKKIVKTELQLLIEDIQRRENSPTTKHSVETINNAFRGTSLERYVLPSVSEIKRIFYTDLKERHQKLINTHQWAPVIIGKKEVVEEIELEKIIDEIGGQKTNSAIRDPLSAETPRPMPFKFIPHRLAKQNYISITTLGPREKDLKNIAAFILGASIIDGESDSLLYKRLREEKGLTYYTYSHVKTFSPHSLMIIESVTSTNNVKNVIEESFKGIMELIDGTTSDFDLEAHKAIVKTQLYGATENTKGMALFLASRIRRAGKAVTPDEMVKIMEKLSINDIIRVIKGYFKRKNISTVMTAHPKTDQKAIQSIVLDAMSTIR